MIDIIKLLDVLEMSDLRVDRQPEVFQVDIEASFVEEQDVMNLAEEMIRESFKKI